MSRGEQRVRQHAVRRSAVYTPSGMPTTMASSARPRELEGGRS